MARSKKSNTNEIVNIPQNLDDVLERYNIPDFRYLKKENIQDLVRMFNSLRPDVQKEIIKHIPSFIDVAKTGIAFCQTLMNKASEVVKNQDTAFLKLQQTRMEALKGRLLKDNITENESLTIMSEMSDITRECNTYIENSRKWWEKILDSIKTYFIPAFMGIGVFSLGLVFAKTKNASQS
ncbi:MAG: hypothetical protein IJK95_03145 [Firmicutes bacterium]|nr:hypothetical protein [Bacillota bacterium]